MTAIYAFTYDNRFAQVGHDGLDGDALYEGLCKLQSEGRLPHIQSIERDYAEEDWLDLTVGKVSPWKQHLDALIAHNLVNRCPAKGARGHAKPEAAAVRWLAFAYPTVEHQGEGGWYYREVDGRRIPLCQGKAALVEYARNSGGIAVDADGRWYALTSLPLSVLALQRQESE